MGSREGRERRKRKQAAKRRERLRRSGPASDRQLAEDIADAGMMAASDLAAKVRQWCLKQGIEPQAQLEAAAGLVYVATLQAEGEQDQSLSPAQLMTSLETLVRRYEADSGESGVMAAAEQVMAFTRETPLDDLLPDEPADEDEEEEEIAPAPPHVQKLLQAHGAMLAKAAAAYWRREGVVPADFKSLQLAAIHVIMNSLHDVRQSPKMETAALLEQVRSYIRENNRESAEYLRAIDQIIDLQLALLRDRQLGKWVVTQLSDEFDEDELRDAFVK